MRDPRIEEYELKFESSVGVAPSKLSQRGSTLAAGGKRATNLKTGHLILKKVDPFQNILKKVDIVGLLKKGRHCRGVNQCVTKTSLNGEYYCIVTKT